MCWYSLTNTPQLQFHCLSTSHTLFQAPQVCSGGMNYSPSTSSPDPEPSPGFLGSVMVLMDLLSTLIMSSSRSYLGRLAGTRVPVLITFHAQGALKSSSSDLKLLTFLSQPKGERWATAKVFLQHVFLDQEALNRCWGSSLCATAAGSVCLEMRRRGFSGRN